MDTTVITEGVTIVDNAFTEVAKTVFTGSWGLFSVKVPGFNNLTFGGLALSVLIITFSVFIFRFIFNMGGKGVSSATRSTNKAKIAKERMNDIK